MTRLPAPLLSLALAATIIWATPRMVPAAGTIGSGEIVVTIDARDFLADGPADDAGSGIESGATKARRYTLLLPPATTIGEIQVDPGFTATPGELGTMRGMTLATVDVRPVAGAPGTELLDATAATKLGGPITLRVRWAPVPPDLAAGIRTRSPIRRPTTRSALELDWLRSHVLNPADETRFYGAAGARAGSGSGATEAPFEGFRPTLFPSPDGPPVEYVIVTDSLALDGRPVGNLVAEFQRLADWKTRQGVPAVVRTVSWIRAHYAGPDDPAKVRAFLIDAYEQWGTDYVLLGGDGRIVPVRRFNGIALGFGHPPSDVYFGGLDQSWDLDRDGVYGEPNSDAGASDPLWDVYVGRAPVEDGSEAHVFVERTLAYGRAPGSDLAGLDPAYATRLLLLEGLGNCAFWGQACNGIYVGEVIHRRLSPAGFQRTRMYQRLLDPSTGCAYHETYVQVADSVQTLWTTNAAFAALNAGQGFVHHFEHSNPYEEGGASGGFGCAVTTGGALGREYIDQLTNKPNWSIVYSTGAGVNAIDYESVSEHWVLNPNGGAAAYVGKTRSGSIANTTGEVDTLFFANVFQAGMPVGQAMGIATQSVSTLPIQSVASFGLLGDPALDPWTAAPAPIAISVEPAVLPLGEQEIAVTIRDAGTQAPIADAMVALSAPTLYVRGTTGSDGTVRFGVHLHTSAAVTVTASGKNRVPATIAVPVGAGVQGPIVYESHAALDDSAAVANLNGIADAGEGLKVDVTLVNRGAAAVAGASAGLDVIGATTIDATLDMSCAPEQIVVGAFGQRRESCALRFPSDEFAGLNPHGRPAPLIHTADPGLFVWREGSTWNLVARAPAGGAGGRWQGGCRIPGGQELFLAGGLEAGDLASVVAPDSIAFDFLLAAAGDVDSLRFVAREGAWVSVPAAEAALGTLAAGGTATARFHVATTGAIPDQHEIRCEVRAVAGGGAAGRSSFGLAISAPDLRYAAQTADLAAGTLRPALRNRALGGSGQVTAVLRLAAGPGTVLDSTATFGAIPPQTTVSAGDTWSFAGADSNLTRFTVAIANTYPDGSIRTWAAGPLDLRRPCAPTDLGAEPHQGRSARLRWNRPANNCAPDLAGYHVYRQLSGTSGWSLVAGDGERDSTQIFQDVTLSPDTTWVYAVAAIDSSGNESPWSTFATTRSWVPERAGWPRPIDAGTPSSPLAIDVDHDGVLEIFALGNALYGFRADGSPLLPSSPDGTLFRPERPLGSMSQGATGAFFGSPAAADLDNDGRVEIAMAAWDDSLWVVDAQTGALRFGRRCVPKFSSPALGDLDGDGVMEVVIGSDTDTLYAWRANGSALNPVFPSGALARLPDGAIINYTTPALADIDGNPQTLEVIHATFRGNVYAWNGSGQLLWTADVGPNRPLSTPAIGDLDHDGTPEVVVAQGNVGTGPAANALYVINAQDGTIERSWEDVLEIPGALTSPGNYVHPPSLADLDGDLDLEIVVGTSGVTWPPPSSPLSGAATVLVFEVEGSSSFALDCRDMIPLPGLNMTNVSQEIVNAQPVIANLDGDPDLELAAGSTTFGLFMFDVAPGLAGCAKEPGWPLLFAGEVESTPVICDLDADGRFDLVTRANDGEVHVFALGADYSSDELQWSQFLHDPRHTSNYVAPFTVAVDPGAGPGAPVAARQFRLYPAAPNPTFAMADIHYELATAGRVELAIYGVDGRLVRVLVKELQAIGPHTSRWDGRDAEGRPQPAGIYFYRLAARDGVVARKLLLMR